METQTIKEQITWPDFEKIDLRMGTIVAARLNEKARKPAYVLEIDFGGMIGRKTTSAQLTDAYQPDDLIGKQIIAVLNFPAKKIADVASEVLVLGAVGEGKPTILLTPMSPVDNGQRVA